RGRRDARPALDAALRAQTRLSAGGAFLQALRRSDGAGGICRPRCRYGAHHSRGARACPGKVDTGFPRRTCANARGVRAGLPRRALLHATRRLAHSPAALGIARELERHPRGAWRRALSLQARHRSPAARPADLPDRRLPGGAPMTTLLWTLIAIQIAMAAFDTIYHHELTERLAWRPSQRHELKLHAARSFVYVAVFIVLGFLELHGLFAILVIVALAVEVVI